jgi:anaerobic selenocysteine-containing dehydrogenase
VAGPSFTFGMPLNADPQANTGSLVVWGDNEFYLMGGEIRETFRSAILGGAKLVVIDPKKIDIAKRADVWISPRPQSDGVLTMGMLKVMIEERL